MNAENTNPENMSGDIVPAPAPLGLTIHPYAVEVFIDLERGKSFTTLHYRRESRERDVVLALIEQVLDDLARVGLPLTKPAKIAFRPGGPSSEPQYTLYMEAAVQPADVQADEQRFVETMRARYRKAG